MKNLKLLLWVSVAAFVMLAVSSEAFGADLSQSEVDELVKAVEQCNPEAQCRLGIMYLIGDNVKKDYEQAEYWLKKSAEQGNSLALMTLAKVYINAQDYKEAEFWLKKLAENDDKKMKDVANETLKEIRAKKAQGSSSSGQASKPQPNQSNSDSVIEIDFEQVFKECRDNGLVYKRKYDGKRVRVSEKIFSIGTYPIDNRIYVRLSYKKKSNWV